MKRQNELETLDMDKLRYLTTTDKLYGYRELCRIVHLPIKSSGSNSQIKQLGALSNVCEYEKIGSKYKFIHMRSPEEIQLYESRATFTPLVEYCLSEKFLDLSESKNQYYHDGIIYLSMGTMLEWAGVVHKNYNYIKNKNYEGRIAISSIQNFNVRELNQFLTISYDQILKPIIRTALKSMDNKRSITLFRSYKLFTIDKTGYKAYTCATSEMPLGQELEHIMANVYTEFNIKSIQSIFFAPKEVQAQVNKRANELCKEKLGYDGFYDCYGLVVHTERTKHNLERMKHEINQRTQTKVLDSKALDKLTTDSKKQFVNTMIDLDTNANFKNDFEEYYRMKYGV